MAEFLGTVQLGGFYNNGTILKRPTKPWRSDSTALYNGCGPGDIPQMSGSMANYTFGNTPSDPANRLQWHKIKDGDKTLLICDRVILVSVSWDDLNGQGYVAGKTVTIDGAKYKCRLLTGGSNYRGTSDGYAGGTPTNNEWDRFIANEEGIAGLSVPASSDLDMGIGDNDKNSDHNQFWNWMGVYSWCQEKPGGTNSTEGTDRGYNSACRWAYHSTSGRYAHVGFRPVLEALPADYKPTLGGLPVGSIVKLKEDGAMVEFLVSKHNYESGLNGMGRTLLVRKDCWPSLIKWNNANVNAYATSAVDSWLNGDYKNLFDSDVQAAMGTTRFYYTPGNGDRALASLARAIFLASYTELGLKLLSTSSNVEGTVLPNAGTILANVNSKLGMLTRTINPGSTEGICTVGVNGNTGGGYATNSSSCFPMFTLSANLLVGDDGTIITNTAPTTPSGITIPGQINGGSTITVEWGAATDAEDNLEGYKVERSLDGGTTWTQIYQGGLTSTTNTVPFGSESVMYRVKAYDAEGLESGWKTSGQVTVINNTAPTVSGSLTVPEQVQGGQPLAISWGASSDGENNLAGYSLERQVDGGEWAVIYSGPELGFTDQITKGWQTVAYRVRAYDTANAYSGFAVSETREVNNNTPPAITCGQPHGANLGVKSEGFNLDYSVDDEEEDAVTVTEAVDGAALRTFAVELRAANSFTLDGEAFMKLLNGRHTLSVTAADDASSATHSLTFEKLVTSASVTLAQPMEADGPISVCVLSASGFIPADAAFTVEVTNNALDDDPAWEDCTAAVRAGLNYVFENQAAANGFAFNFRLAVERGESGTGGYITSVQGGFQ